MRSQNFPSLFATIFVFVNRKFPLTFIINSGFQLCDSDVKIFHCAARFFLLFFLANSHSLVAKLRMPDDYRVTVSLRCGAGNKLTTLWPVRAKLLYNVDTTMLPLPLTSSILNA